MRDHAFVTVVGVSFDGRQQTLNDLLRNYGSKHFWGKLLRDPFNQFDRNAIAVLVAPSEGALFRSVGFIPKALAAKWAPKMDRGQLIEVTETSITEGRRGTYGCKIRVHIQEERHGTEDAATA